MSGSRFFLDAQTLTKFSLNEQREDAKIKDIIYLWHAWMILTVRLRKSQRKFFSNLKKVKKLNPVDNAIFEL